MLKKSQGGISSGAQLMALLSAQLSGDTNNSSSGSGSDYNHNLTYSIPANYLTAGKLLRVTLGWKMTTGASANLTIKLKAGSTLLSQNVAGVPTGSVTGMTFATVFYLQAIDVPGAAANVQILPISNYASYTNVLNINNVTNPVALATNGALSLVASTLWSAAGTGTNAITLSQMIVEALN